MLLSRKNIGLLGVWSEFIVDLLPTNIYLSYIHRGLVFEVWYDFYCFDFLKYLNLFWITDENLLE